MELSKQQRECVNSILEWQHQDYQDQIFNVHGFAGTGKTTTLGFVKKNLFQHLRVLYMSYTGMAVQNLLKYGCDPAVTGTIHSMIKRPDDNGFRNISKDDLITKDQGLNDTVNIFNADLIVVDENSMVDPTLIQDLKKYEIPILTFGDKFQLPPIVAEGAQFQKSEFISRTDFLLDQVHRQALDSEIIQVATMIRNQNWEALLQFKPEKDAQIFWTERDRFLQFPDYGQPLCYQNFTRYDLTKKIKGVKYFIPEVGNPIVCMKNNKHLKIYNGQLMRIESIGSMDENDLTFMFDGRSYSSTMKYFNLYNQEFNRDTLRQAIQAISEDLDWHRNAFDYAYVLTVHKAQGSQWDTVTLYDDNYSSPDHEYARWLYTGVTRARKNLNLMLSRSLFKRRFGI